MNHKKPALTEHLAFLSIRYDVFVAELFGALVSARTTGEAACANLNIKYRGSVKNEAIFLITRDNAVITQFRAPEELLLRRDLPFESWMDTDKIRGQIAKRDRAVNGHSILIQDLRHGMKRVNLEAKVLENPKPQQVYTRYGNSAVVSNACIGDETGKVKICLWNEQTKFFSVGNRIQIKNASVSSYKGERQLRLGKAATVVVLSSCPEKDKLQRERAPNATICV